MNNSRSGFSLIQVLILQAVALVLFAVLLSVGVRSSKVAGASAGQTALQALVLQSRFLLSDTQNCTASMLPNTAINVLTATPPSGTNELNIINPVTGATVLRGSSFGGPGFTKTADFTVQSVQLQVSGQFGRTVDYPAATEKRYLATVVVTAKRNSVAGGTAFLGSPSITQSFPIMIQMGSGVLETCSARNRYLITIGSGGTAKSVFECMDRDGVPVQVPIGLNNYYYVCQIPYSPGTDQVMFANGCSAPTSTAGAGMLNHEGWTPDTHVAPAGFIYCI